MLRTIRQKLSILMWIVVAAFVATIIFSWGMGGIKKTDPRQEGIIAVINGQNVKFAELKQIEENYLSGQKEKDLSGVKRAELKNKAWDDFVKMIVIRQELEKQDISVSKEQLYHEILTNPLPELKNSDQFKTNGVFDQKKYENFIKNPNPQYEAFYKAIESAYEGRLPGMKLEKRVSYSAYISDFELLNMYMQSDLKAQVKFLKAETNSFMPADSTITDAEIEKYFKENPSGFPKFKEKRSYEYVLFSTAPTSKDSALVLEDINYAMKQIQNGIPFEEVAKNYSEDDTASKGGDLGFFGRGKMVPEFEEAAFNANVGEVVGPVKTKYGYHLIKVISKKREGDEVKEVQASHILIKFKTHQETYEDASYAAVSFRDKMQELGGSAESFNKAAQELGLKVMEGPFTTPTDRTNELGIIPGLGDFLFDNKPGTISPFMVCDNGYAYIKVKEIQPEREKTLEEVKSRIIYDLKKEKGLEKAYQKLVEIESAIVDTVAMNEAAASTDGLITGTSNKFAVNVYIDKVGVDRAMYEKAMAMETGDISEPFKGEQGAYMIFLIEKDILDEEKWNTEKKGFREKQETYLQRQMIQEWLDKLVKDADVEDLRNLYYR